MDKIGMRGKLGSLVLSLEHLDELARQRKSVWIHAMLKVVPAAFAINLNGSQLLGLFRLKSIRVYEAAPRKSRRRDNVDSSSSAGSFSWGDSFLSVGTKTKQ